MTETSKGHPFAEMAFVGAPGRIRTSGPLIRSQVLYPAELRVRIGGGHISGVAQLGKS